MLLYRSRGMLAAGGKVQGMGVGALGRQVGVALTAWAGRPASVGAVISCVCVTRGRRRGWPVTQPAGLVWQEQMALHFGVFCSKWVLRGWNDIALCWLRPLVRLQDFCFRAAGAKPAHPAFLAPVWSTRPFARILLHPTTLRNRQFF